MNRWGIPNLRCTFVPTNMANDLLRQIRKCPFRSRKIGEHKLGSGPHGHERDHRGREQEGRQEEGEEGGRCRRRRLLRRLMRHLVNAQLYPSLCFTVLHVCVQHQDNFLSYACNFPMNKPLRHATCDGLNFERPLALQGWAKKEWSQGWQVCLSLFIASQIGDCPSDHVAN